MEGNHLDKKELLEQYVLGLTDKEQSERVRAILKNDPEARRDLAYLREQLTAYADSYTKLKTPTDRNPRSPEEFADLDHEMIMAMTERNHSLTIWRYALGAACLLLLVLSGFLFRQYQTSQSALVSERAAHAQDDVSHQLELKHLEEASVDITALHTERTNTDVGDILVHYPEHGATALLDFSHLEAPEKGVAYFLFLGDRDDRPADIVLPASALHQLYPIELPAAQLRIYRWPLHEQPAPPLPLA
ncbi:MAG: hypothetical protein AAFZ52_17785, partial [Bacteroidota bacterium]